MRIANIILIALLTFVLAGCSPGAKHEVKAVYLIGDEQQLSAKDLEEHPEVMIVSSYNDLKDGYQKTKQPYGSIRAL